MKSARIQNWFPAKGDADASFSGRAFTLIEIMVVVAIFGVVLTMGVPAIYRMFNRDAFRTMVANIVEKCNRTRTQAIMQGEIAELRFRPQAQDLGLGEAGPSPERGAGHQSGGVMLEMLDVNFIEYKDSDLARVRFYPNGTSDELTIVLRSDKNEYRKISLECTTGLTTVEDIW